MALPRAGCCSVGAAAPRRDTGRFQRTEHYLAVLGRLASGVSLQTAQQELDAIAANLARAHPTTNAGIGAEAQRLTDHLTQQARPGLLLLQGAVLLVLLIGAANVANLLLARVTMRHRELAVREALGAGRWRVARQLLVESMLLALAGGACGWFLAYAGFDLLLSLVPSSVPRLVPIRLDYSTLLFGLLLAVATGLIAGMAPVFSRGRLNLVTALTDSSRVTGRPRVRHTLGGLVVVEMALVTVLVIATGLMVRSLTNLRNVDLGFTPERLWTASVTLSNPDLEAPDDATEDRATLQFREILSRLQALPGVESAAAASMFPLTGDYAGTRVVQEGRIPTDLADIQTVDYTVVTPTYLRTMGSPLSKGRFFDDTDVERAMPVAIINEEMAERYWPGESAVGQRIRRGGLDATNFPWMTIVGVVGNIRHLSVDAAPVPELFIPHAQFAWPQMTIVVRAERDVTTVASSMREAVRDVDGNHYVGSVRTAEQVLGASISGRNFAMRLLATFAALALSLALVGIYGVVAYGVGQRTHEIGLRMALGAQPLSILTLVMREVLIRSAIGLILGAAAALMVGRTMASLLYEISPIDATSFVATVLILGAAGAIAAYLPSRRAASLDPMAALRNE
jgi:putative ABC transport system permease protein